MPEVFVKEFVQIGIRNDTGEAVELAVFCDLLRRLDERVHCDTRQGSTDADTANAELGKIVHCKAERTGIEKINRLRRDGLHRRGYLFAGLDAGRIETVGSGVGESLQPADGLIEVRSVADESFRAAGQNDVATRLVDRIPGGAHTLHGEVEVV